MENIASSGHAYTTHVMRHDCYDDRLIFAAHIYLSLPCPDRPVYSEPFQSANVKRII